MTKTYDEPEAAEATETVVPAWDPTGSVYARVLAILAELPAIGKNQRNTQQGFNFRGHDDVLNALNPLLAKWGVFLVPEVLKRTEAQRTTSRGGVMYEVNLHVRYTFYGPDGDSFTASAWGEGTDSGDKSTNKAMTMAFKNVIQQTFAVSTEESYDTDRDSPEETQGRAGSESRGRQQRGAAAAAQREFDPAKDLRTGAHRVTDEASMETLRAAVAFLDPSIRPEEWQQIEDEARAHVYGRTLTPEQWGEHWKRLANAEHAARAAAQEAGLDWPPQEKLAAAFAWAFNGYALPGATPEQPEGAAAPEEAAEALLEAAAEDHGA